METKTDSTGYLLFFRNTGPETHSHLSAKEREQLVARWNSWYDQLASAGKATGGQPLDLETRVAVSGPGGSRVIDGPFVEAKEVIGGYVLLKVSGLEEATEIAKRHPGLAYGLEIDIRKFSEECHLGIIARQTTETAASVH